MGSVGSWWSGCNVQTPARLAGGLRAQAEDTGPLREERGPPAGLRALQVHKSHTVRLALVPGSISVPGQPGGWPAEPDEAHPVTLGCAEPPPPVLAPGTWCGRGCALEIVPGSRNASDENSHWARGVLVWSSWGCGTEGAARIGQRSPIGDRAFSSSAYSWCDVSFATLDYRSTC